MILMSKIIQSAISPLSAPWKLAAHISQASTQNALGILEIHAWQEVPSGSSAAAPDWNFPFFWRISGDFPGKIIYKWSFYGTLQMSSFLNSLIQTSLTGESPAGISSPGSPGSPTFPWWKLTKQRRPQNPQAARASHHTQLVGLLECVWRHWLLWRCARRCQKKTGCLSK